MSIGFEGEKLARIVKIKDIINKNPGITLQYLYDKIEMTTGLSEKNVHDYLSKLININEIAVDPSTLVVTVCR